MRILRFDEVVNPNQYGVLYARPVFPVGDKLEWLNYNHLALPPKIQEQVNQIITPINQQYVTDLIIPLDYSLQAGCLATVEKIEEIANQTFQGLSSIFPFHEAIRLVWGIGSFDPLSEIIRQAQRGDKASLHYLDSYPILVEVGRTLDKDNQAGIFKI